MKDVTNMLKSIDKKSEENAPMILLIIIGVILGLVLASLGLARYELVEFSAVLLGVLV